MSLALWQRTFFFIFVRKKLLCVVICQVNIFFLNHLPLHALVLMEPKSNSMDTGKTVAPFEVGHSSIFIHLARDFTIPVQAFLVQNHIDMEKSRFATETC